MPSKTTRIRRGVLLAGKKDRIVIEEWSCNVCQARFGDYHDAVVHEHNCRLQSVIASRIHRRDGENPSEIQNWELLDAPSDGCLSISSTTNVNNNTFFEGDNRESEGPPSDVVIPRVIHVANRPHITSTMMPHEAREDTSTLRQDLRRDQMLASNINNGIEERLHVNQASPIIGREPARGKADNERPQPLHSPHFEEVTQHGRHEDAFGHRHSPQYHIAEPYMVDVESGRRSSQPAPTTEGRTHAYPNTRRHAVASTIESTPPEHASYPPAHRTINGGSTGHPSPRRIGMVGGEHGDTPVVGNTAPQHRKGSQYTGNVSHHQGQPRRGGSSNHQDAMEMQHHPPQSTPQMKWLCDSCRTAQFENYVDAFRHEIQCRKTFLLGQQQKELESFAHSEPENELRLSANRRPRLHRETIQRHNVHENSRSLCSTVGDRNPTTTISSITESFMGAVGLSVKPLPASQVTRWLCSICKEVCFDHYLDACRHERECALVRMGQQQIRQVPRHDDANKMGS
jgi:hypothetical protein